MINRTSITYSRQIQNALDKLDGDTMQAVILMSQDIAVINSLLATSWSRSLVEKIWTWRRPQLDTLVELHADVKKTDRFTVSVFSKANDPDRVYAEVVFYKKHNFAKDDAFPWNPNGIVCKIELQYEKGNRCGWVDYTSHHVR